MVAFFGLHFRRESILVRNPWLLQPYRKKLFYEVIHSVLFLTLLHTKKFPSSFLCKAGNFFAPSIISPARCISKPLRLPYFKIMLQCLPSVSKASHKMLNVSSPSSCASKAESNESYDVSRDGLVATCCNDVASSSFGEDKTIPGGFKDYIATHSGRFHTDEALACVLMLYLPEFSDCKIIRTRNEKLIDQAKVVVDVGGVYDHQRKRYDHHQKTFSQTFSPHHCTTKLSSVGLIFMHYGRYILESKFGISDNPGKLDWTYWKLYEHFLESIDALDNGISASESNKLRYMQSTDLGSRISRLNPSWKEHDALESDKFRGAMELVREEFLSQLDVLLNDLWPARVVVMEALERRFEVDSSGEILIFPVGCPALDHIHDLERGESAGSKVGDAPLVKFFIHPESKTSNWILRGVPEKGCNFTPRLALPKSLRGLRNEELNEAAREYGISGLVFVHSAGHLGVTTSKETAKQLALAALNQNAREVESKDRNLF